MAGGRIIIHPGAPKTGSTYVQRRLRVDPPLLREHGIHVPVPEGVEAFAGNAKLLAAVLGAETRGLRQLVDVAALDPREVAARYLSAWRPGREALVLSAEDLRPWHAAPLRDLLPADARCTPVLVVRNQFRWFESNHQQRVKLGRFRGDVSALVAETLAGDHYCPDWLSHRAAWHDAFGDCRVLLYEDAAGDLLGAFARVAGLSLPPALPDIPRQKTSLDAFGLAYLLEPAAPVSPDEHRLRQRAARAASTRIEAPRVSFLTDTDVERIRERFAESNRRLLALLGRPYDGSPLDLGAAPQERATLEEIRASSGYRAYRRLADSILAGEDRLGADARAVDRLRRVGRRLRRGG